MTTVRLLRYTGRVVDRPSRWSTLPLMTHNRHERMSFDPFNGGRQ
jgi:hypothetical protein